MEWPGDQLANTLQIERTCTPDQKAMLAALRVVLGIRKPLPESGATND